MKEGRKPEYLEKNPGDELQKARFRALIGRMQHPVCQVIRTDTSAIQLGGVKSRVYV